MMKDVKACFRSLNTALHSDVQKHSASFGRRVWNNEFNKPASIMSSVVAIEPKDVLDVLEVIGYGRCYTGRDP